MKKQIWVICNQEEQKELLSHLKDYKVDEDINANKEKQNFPLIVDTELKLVYRCTSVTSCGLYTSSNGKIKHYSEIKSEILKQIHLFTI